MLITHNLKIDLVRPTILPPVAAVQGDTNTRQVRCELYAAGQPWEPPAGAVAVARYGKVDGTVGRYDTLPDGTQAWSIHGNVITMTLCPQLLAVPGRQSMQISIIDGDDEVSTFTLSIDVSADPSKGAITSEDYVPNGSGVSMAQLATRLPQPDGDVSVGDYLKVAEVNASGRVVRMVRANPPTPVKGVDYWTPEERAALVLEVIDSVKVEYPEAHVIYGDIDGKNLITLHGDLPQGKYTLNFEDDAGNILGSVTMELGGPAYTNRADPTSADWAVDKRLNSSAELADAAGCHTTNFFPCKKGDVIRVKGLDIRYTDSGHSQNARAWFFKSDGNPCVGTYVVSDPKFVFDGVDTFTITLDGVTNIGGGNEIDIAKGRFSGMLIDGYAAEDIIITVNQEIIE
jgi:hypothetical protein